MVFLQFLVLENVGHRFKLPHVMDIKLGTILYDDFATPEKRARMEKSARDTTSFETGIRITGFKVNIDESFSFSFTRVPPLDAKIHVIRHMITIVLSKSRLISHMGKG